MVTLKYAIVWRKTPTNNKKIASLLAIALVLALNPIVAHAEWKKDSTGWWFADGDSRYKGWNQIGEKWYYFKK